MLASLFACLFATCNIITVVTNSGNTVYGLPSRPDYVIEREGYAIGYSTQHWQSVWVAYHLTRYQVMSNICRRCDDFRPDPLLGDCSPTLDDYKRSGYDRGHLCPAADRHFSTNLMSETFFMSNMSPQRPELNRMAWRELEEWVRLQAIVKTNIFVYTGPIFSTNFMLEVIGPHKIPVPESYYKILLAEGTTNRNAIAFVYPNDFVIQPMRWLAFPVRTVERLTGLDFFSSLPQEEQDRFETTSDLIFWGL